MVRSCEDHFRFNLGLNLERINSGLNLGFNLGFFTKEEAMPNVFTKGEAIPNFFTKREAKPG